MKNSMYLFGTNLRKMTCYWENTGIGLLGIGLLHQDWGNPSLTTGDEIGTLEVELEAATVSI